jgi:hypothetical protein
MGKSSSGLDKQSKQSKKDKIAHKGSSSSSSSHHKTEKEEKKERKREKKAKKREQRLKEEATTDNNDDGAPAEVAVEENRHTFVTNTLDHCETPRIAYEHIQPVILELSKYNSDDELKIWDPYYCDGSAKRHLELLGFTNVIHKNDDFYATIAAANKIPSHNLFLTNPPYSDDHIERLLQFLSTHKQDFCLLMPNWVARKKDYRTLMTKDVFYLSPVQPYTYAMPEWNDRPEHVAEDGKTTPYLSSWYIHAGNNTEAIMNKMNSLARGKWVVAKTIKGLKWKLQKLKR